MPNSETPGGAQVQGAVGEKVEPSALEHTSLSRVDYVDHFVISPVDASARPPERWARALFGDVPSLAERLIWQGLLQLRLRGSRSPRVVAGWSISARGEDWIQLATSSWAMSANLVVRASERELSLTTLVQYDRVASRLVWTPLSAVHRRLAPGLLRDAVARVSREHPSSVPNR